MSVNRSPEVHDSRGLVRRRAAGGEAAAGLLEAVAEGMRPELAARAVLEEVGEDRRRLPAVLQALLHRALQLGEVGAGVTVVAQFARIKDFPGSLETALASLLRHHAPHPFLPALLATVCTQPALAPHAPSTTLLAVNSMVEWVTPSADLVRDLGAVAATRRLLEELPLLAGRQPAALRLVYRQARAAIVATGEDRGSYRDALVDLVVFLARLQDSGGGYLVEGGGAGVEVQGREQGREQGRAESGMARPC